MLVVCNDLSYLALLQVECDTFGGGVTNAEVVRTRDIRARVGVVLAPTRWKLRRAIQQVNQCLNALSVRKHPDKTSIGRTEKGFDFLGHRLQIVETQKETDKKDARKPLHISNRNIKKVSLKPATKSIQKMLDNIARLYEQGAEFSRIEQYIQRWEKCFVDNCGIVMSGLVNAYGNQALIIHEVIHDLSFFKYGLAHLKVALQTPK